MSAQMSRIYQLGAIGITVVAGLWTLFHLIWTLTNHSANDFWGPALLVLFLLALLLAFIRYSQERQALLASTPKDDYPDPAIARFFLATAGAAAMWFVLRMSVGADWLVAGWEKELDRGQLNAELKRGAGPPGPEPMLAGPLAADVESD
jgi:hypothetical protein